MWWFKKPQKPIQGRMLELASGYVPAGEGLKMIASQSANEVLRHCRIGLVRVKIDKPA